MFNELKNKKITMIKKMMFVALAMMMAVSGCKAGEQTENNTEKAANGLVKELRTVGKFSGISLIGSCRVICMPGNKASVMVEAPEGELDKLLTEVKNGMLTISREKIAGVRVLAPNKKDRTTVYVTMPTLRSVKLVGSGDVIVKGKVENDDKLNVSLSGSGDIEFNDIDVKFSNFSLAGSGDIKTGNVKSRLLTEISLAGSGDIKVGNIETDNAKVSLAGSGDVYASQVKALNVSVSAVGSGDVKIGYVDCASLHVKQVSSSDITIGKIKAVTTNVNKTGSGSLKLAGMTNTYNEVKHGNGKIDKSGLKYDKTTQKKQASWQSVSRGNGTTSPNGIEAEP